jgi:hypothetical protein
MRSSYRVKREYREAHEVAVRAIVEEGDFPCLGAKSALHTDGAVFCIFDQLGAAETARVLIDELRAFGARTVSSVGFSSFLALFRGPALRSESQFERLLWRQLQLLHELDSTAWSEGVSNDPDSPYFAFSVAGIAYFVVGLHPHASRLSRCAPFPVLAFNPHAQFEALRGSGKYQGLHDAILRRDNALQGCPNPMLGDHGSSPAAAQYSGRRVGSSWKAPFHARGRRVER